MNNNNQYSNTAKLLFLLCLTFNVVNAAEQAAPGDKATTSATAVTLAGKYTEKGADTCIKCHDEDSEYPVFDIFMTKHGQRGDPRAPFAGLQCEACHGPGATHSKKVRPGKKQAPITTFGTASKLSADKLNPVSSEKQNQVCLDCHQGDSHIAWKGSKHEGGDIACANCHIVHAAQEPVLTKMTQAEVCYKCHKKERAEFYKPSHHPVRFGQITCTECHSPHGAITASLLVKPTLNETCFTCHAEKRGPFLWEHAPVSEDCTLCHSPHGSVHRALLKKTAPLLCQQCHSQAGHPGVAYTGAGLPSGSASGFMLAGACLNCHSQVHGSNHPSGVKLMR